MMQLAQDWHAQETNSLAAFLAAEEAYWADYEPDPERNRPDDGECERLPDPYPLYGGGMSDDGSDPFAED